MILRLALWFGAFGDPARLAAALWVGADFDSEHLERLSALVRGAMGLPSSLREDVSDRVVPSRNGRVLMNDSPRRIDRDALECDGLADHAKNVALGHAAFAGILAPVRLGFLFRNGPWQPKRAQRLSVFAGAGAFGAVIRSQVLRQSSDQRL
jgi:hypothetical protein